MSAASYDAAGSQLSKLAKLNFVFGSNGTGKSTIAKVIAEESSHPTCKVAWKNGSKLQALVYNQDFVDKNFTQTQELRGVFTLGKQGTETLGKINALRLDLTDLNEKIQNLKQTLGDVDGSVGKYAELANLESQFKETCWLQKQKHDPKLQEALKGFRDTKEKFKSKVLHESTSNTVALVPLIDLEEKAKTIFGPTPVTEALVTSINAAKLLAHEEAAILKKPVLGKGDVDIAAMIKKLGNSDWVREGHKFHEVNDNVCPFCQQQTSDAFAQSLADYFDESFEEDSKAIQEIEISYKTDATQVTEQLALIIATPSKFIDLERLKTGKALLDSLVSNNTQKIAIKKKEPSQIIELESLGDVLNTINVNIDEANQKIVTHNKTVANINQERKTLTVQVWKYIVEHELKQEIASFKKQGDGFSAAITSLKKQIETEGAAKQLKEVEIQNLEKLTTSIQPTIDGINNLLANFGFRGFKLAKASDAKSYKLVRSNGTEAKTTLSEGEKTFVTFLYFYHLLKGSQSETGTINDRVVVFDDPVSSLDSEVLFIVSSLIKGLFDEVRNNNGHIKQVFVLTHNVYFHKEVAFNPKRPKKGAPKDETFWVVRKPNDISVVESHPCNPITTSYDLLWDELRKTDRSTLTIQNTMRRILENYFKILGGIDLNDICDQFDGKDKVTCKSLISWVNDGSHF
ncbi:MAG: hypothetical protein ACD_66C00015G0001, partial [uncultured bacterium]